MPIYEFSCAKCRKIFSFLSKRLNPDRLPVCPKCGNKRLTKQMSAFAMPRGLSESAAPSEGVDPGGDPMSEMDDPKVMRAMAELERDMANNVRSLGRCSGHLCGRERDARGCSCDH